MLTSARNSVSSLLRLLLHREELCPLYEVRKIQFLAFFLFRRVFAVKGSHNVQIRHYWYRRELQFC